MRLLFMLLLWLSLVDLSNQKSFDSAVFGVKISQSSTGSIISYIALRYSADGNLREKRPCNKDEFIKIISGFWPTNFNSKRENFFEKNGVVGGVFVNDTLLQKVSYCPALDSLWKIRYSDYPFSGNDEKGWSLSGNRPSLKQEKYLSDRYHIKQLDFEYIIDSNFWNLMRDVSDTIWISNYRFIQ